MKRILILVFTILYAFPFFGNTIIARAALVGEEKKESSPISLTASSALVMEAMTGKILYAKEETKALPPASVTKIMTLLLIFEAVDSGKISLQDSVSVSEHAASMGGSQVFLEAGETQSVEVMIKSIAIASGNDAAVAMAEYIAGSEEAFVQRMNEKAKKLGMKQTVFQNCCGLDTDGHVTCAKDIAVMSRELILKHPNILKYSSIWMDEFTHKTKKGESVFGLSNTNKLLKQYPGCNGLKTGSTSKAKFCLSATATRNNISLIAVVMASNSSKDRIKDCSALLDYGFANCKGYEIQKLKKKIKPIPVVSGEEMSVPVKMKKKFRTILSKEETAKDITYNIQRKKKLQAPVKKGMDAGWVTFYKKGELIGKEKLITTKNVKRLSFSKSVQRILYWYLV